MLHYLELYCSNSFKAWFELLAETYWHGELKVVLDNFDTMEFEYPTNPETYDVICITGSDSAAFDDKDWIHRLCDYIREVRDKRYTKLVGFCFGHQVMHLALGGVAEINPGGTEIGKVTVDLTDVARKHLKTERKTFGVYLGHRDHVPKMAAGFENLGSTAPTPIQGGILGNEMLSWQVHPELPAELMLAFLISQKNGSLTMNGGANKMDPKILDGWIDSFYTSPGSNELAPIDALWCGAKTVSWILGDVLTDEEIDLRLRTPRATKTAG